MCRYRALIKENKLSILDIIKKKRDGGKLTHEEIAFFVAGATKGTIPDYQLSALLMAIYLNGMDIEETSILTLEMAESGDMLDFSDIGTVLDKHSTGGVGDKTTIVVGPILAALGVRTAKMSGRGLGHTGGTVDKLESIPGFRSDLSEEEFKEVVRTVGFSDIGQTKNLAPADKVLYALRDVTGTVENYSLIASSIMSKKLAAGADGIVLDVKCGSGAFMKDYPSAEKLAKVMVDIGNNAGRKTSAFITDMNEPLGRFVGNCLEIIECVEALKGRGEERFIKLVYAIAGEMLNLTGKKDDGMIEKVINDGSALMKFREFIRAHGGDDSFIDDYNRLGKIVIKEEVKFNRAGYLSRCDTEKVGLACMKLGGGREKLSDTIDHSVGIEIKKKLGDFVETDETAFIIYGNDEAKVSEAEELLKGAYEISDTPTPKPDVILGRIIL